MNKNISFRESIRILDKFCEEIKRSDLKTIFLISGMIGEVNRVTLVADEDKETIVGKFEKILYSHVYSVQSAQLSKKERSVQFSKLFFDKKLSSPVLSHSSGDLTRKKQTLMNDYYQQTNCRDLVDSLAVPTSTPSNKIKATNKLQWKRLFFERPVLKGAKCGEQIYKWSLRSWRG